MVGTWYVMSTSMIDYCARFVSEIINSHNVLHSDVTFEHLSDSERPYVFLHLILPTFLCVCGKKTSRELWPLSTHEPVKVLFLGYTRHKIYNNIPRIENNLKEYI